MKTPITSLGVIQESRDDESRAPLVPIHIKKIKEKYPSINIIVQPSKLRTFNENEYIENGAEISDNLQNCDVIFGVKEVDDNILIPEKTYIFFSHTYKLNKETLTNAQGTPGMDKKKLLKTIISKKIKLIDYENIRDENGTRYLGFGRFAGIVGCYNTLNLFLSHNKFIPMARAFKLNNYERLINNIQQIRFPNFKLLITGDGRVARGVLDVLDKTNIKRVSKSEYLDKIFNEPIYCNLETKDYLTHDRKKDFNLEYFIKNPHEYQSNAMKFLKESHIFISAHYWDPNSPKIFKKNELKDFSQLQIIGDITCDVDGSVPSTIRSTTIDKPNFYLDKINMIETNDEKNNIGIMAVDNLPSELPRDSSTEFGDGIVNEVLPYILEKDDGRILNATIAKAGCFLEKYSYLKKYINS